MLPLWKVSRTVQHAGELKYVDSCIVTRHVSNSQALATGSFFKLRMAPTLRNLSSSFSKVISFTRLQALELFRCLVDSWRETFYPLSRPLDHLFAQPGKHTHSRCMYSQTKYRVCLESEATESNASIFRGSGCSSWGNSSKLPAIRVSLVDALERC